MEGGEDENDALLKELDYVRAQTSALEKSLIEKELLLLDKDEVLLFLEQEIQALKEKDPTIAQLILEETYGSIEQQRLKAADLEKDLREREKGLMILNEQAHILEETTKRHIAKYEDLARQSAEKAISLEKELASSFQSDIGTKVQKIPEVHKKWLPSWFGTFVVQSWSVTFTNVVSQLHLHISTKASMLRSWFKDSNRKMQKHCKGIFTFGTLKFQVLKGKGELQLKALESLVVKKLRKVWRIVNSRLQDAKENTVTTTLQPFLNRIQTFLGPFPKGFLGYYHKALKYATKSHRQMQRFVRRMMKTNKYLSSFASKEVIWFLASALMFLPLYSIFILVSSSFWR